MPRWKLAIETGRGVRRDNEGIEQNKVIRFEVISIEKPVQDPYSSEDFNPEVAMESRVDETREGNEGLTT